MARQPLNIAGVDQIWQTALYDDNGNPILQVSAGEYIIHGPNGEVTIKGNLLVIWRSPIES